MRPIAILAAATVCTYASAGITGFNGLADWEYTQADNETPASLPDPDTIRLTNSGGTQLRSIFHDERQSTALFTASFTYRGNFGFNVDQGASFILHNDPRGSSAIGGFGGELGYAGIANSVATTWDIRRNRLSFSMDGVVSAGVLVEGITLGGDNDIDFTLIYDGTFLTQRLVDTVTGVEFSQNILVGDLSSTLGGDLAYVGFGASSRGSDQFFSDFRFTSVPGPGASLVLGAGLFAAGRRRR